VLHLRCKSGGNQDIFSGKKQGLVQEQVIMWCLCLQILPWYINGYRTASADPLASSHFRYLCIPFISFAQYRKMVPTTASVTDTKAMNSSRSLNLQAIYGTITTRRCKIMSRPFW
jgi:hypothetical protein